MRKDQRPHVVVVDDETNVRRVLGTLLEQAGFQTTRVGSGDEALQIVRAQDPDLVLTDLKMPGMDGMELLERLRRQFPEIPVVMLTAHGTVEAAVEAMRRGAHDFLTKPFDKGKVVEIISKAMGQAERSRMEFLGPLAGEHDCGIVGNTQVVKTMKQLLRKMATSPSTVLITGETGTGKELVADALHSLSDRREAPLVKINCGALPENLVESELFGHERGAFTGAEQSKPGRFELAHKGTLFLDEIGELPLSTQVKLLRVLQDRVVDRLGGTSPTQVDVRLIAATNRDLQKEVQGGNFREDLLYRLQVLQIQVPPLRQRLEDIPLLVDFFIAKHAERLGRDKPEINAAVLETLATREWPGNVRELENTVERAVLLSSGPVLETTDFGIQDQPTGPTPTGGDLKSVARAAAARAELAMITEALEATGGNVTHAADRLGLSRRGLQLKMKELGLR
jgi:DNA-binding NtrC family response regulator